jgi:putative membrane protein
VNRIGLALLGSITLLGAQNMAPVSAPTTPPTHLTRLASVDDAFATAAMQGNDAELYAANLALQHSHTDGVLAFARLMIVDHSMIGKEGAPLIKHHLVHNSPPLGAPDELAMRYLAGLSPVDFDQQYALLQIGDHLATLTAFATEARDGKDPSLKAFAMKWQPTIQPHLELAVTLVKHVGGDTPFRE